MGYTLAKPIVRSAQPGVHYLYFGRNLWRSHHGVLTVGAVVCDSVSAAGPTGKVVKLAFAFCSPSDEFVRYTEHRIDNKTKKETVLKGGIDIVNGRLGLVPSAIAAPRCCTVPLIGTVLQTVMTFFNEKMPRCDKPGLWRSRQLAVAPRQAFFRLGCWSREEFDQLDKLVNPAGQEAGFFPLVGLSKRRRRRKVKSAAGAAKPSTELPRLNLN